MPWPWPFRSRRDPRFDMVVWELTLRCDQACLHCGSRAGRARPAELDTAEALALVGELAEAGAGEVALIGGEAYLRPDWDVIARAVTDHGLRCSMVTGGRGLDAAVAARARAAGVVNVAVSIDGLEATHDRLRGVAGSYRAARAALRHLARAGVARSVNTQINRASSPELEALLDVLRPEGIWAWHVHLTIPLGRAADDPGWLLQPGDLLDLVPRLARLGEACAAAGIALCAGNNIGYFGPHEGGLRDPRSGRRHWTGCAGGRRTLGIEADGTVKGCLSLPTLEYAGARAGGGRLRAAIEEAAARMDRAGADGLWGFCRTCSYAGTCLAGCVSTAHVLFGRPGNNPYCHHRVLELARRGLRERLVRRAPAPGRPFDRGRFDLVLEEAGAGEVCDGRLHPV